MQYALATYLSLVTAVLLVVCESAVGFEYRFAGIVQIVPPALAGEFSMGEVVSGRMSISLLQSLPRQTEGQVTDFYATIGNDYPITANDGRFTILNDFGGALDGIRLGVGSQAAPVNGHAVETFEFILNYNDSNDLTSSDFLPQFVFGDPRDRSGLNFSGEGSLKVYFQLTDLSQVPEPIACYLAATPFALFILFNRGRLNIAT